MVTHWSLGTIQHTTFVDKREKLQWYETCPKMSFSNTFAASKSQNPF